MNVLKRWDVASGCPRSHAAAGRSASAERHWHTTFVPDAADQGSDARADWALSGMQMRRQTLWTPVATVRIDGLNIKQAIYEQSWVLHRAHLKDCQEHRVFQC